MICPHCNHIIEPGLYELKLIKQQPFKMKQSNRQEMVLSYIKDNVTISKLYQSLRIFGYARKRKTLYRDLKDLEAKNKIKLEIKTKSDGGFETIITKCHL